MTQKNHHLNQSHRKVIYQLLKAGLAHEKIAKVLGCHRTTVSREIARNSGQKGYRYKQAHRLAQDRQEAKAHRERVITGKVKDEVERLLKEKYSPEQISAFMAKKDVGISHEVIYQYVADDRKQGGHLYKNLRINGRRRYRWRSKASRCKIPNRTGIEERPVIVNERGRYGDWEVDLIEGVKGSGYLVSVIERKSRIGLLAKVETKESQRVAKAIAKLLNGYQVHTLTYDNGAEFAAHEWVNKRLGCASYFCAPYSSWEKGGVENYNGLVRQYYPKGTSFEWITNKDLRAKVDQLNQRLRKVLNWASPVDFMKKLKLPQPA